MTTKTEKPDSMTESEYAELGRKLATAWRTLIELKDEMQDAVKEMKKGIEAQAKHVAEIAEQIRTGQRDLFSNGITSISSELKGQPETRVTITAEDAKSFQAGAGKN